MPDNATVGQQAVVGQAAMPATLPEAASETPATFDEFLAKQPDDIKGLYEQHTSGLKSALASEREQRKQLEKSLRDAARQAGEGSDTKKLLEKTAEQLQLAERRATFAEEAVKPEIGCANARAAWLVAMSDELFDKRGNPDWAAIKAAAPELFRQKVPAANAGSGTGAPPPGKATMNEFIRRAAGRQ